MFTRKRKNRSEFARQAQIFQNETLFCSEKFAAEERFIQCCPSIIILTALMILRSGSITTSMVATVD
ncbi:MAG: hypothetical protein ACO3S0_11455, partial [bacterium]